MSRAREAREREPCAPARVLRPSALEHIGEHTGVALGWKAVFRCHSETPSLRRRYRRMKQDALPPTSQRNAADNVDHAAGFAYGIAAYGLWGLIPLYFRLLRTVPSLEMLAHRAAWAFLTL